MNTPFQLRRATGTEALVHSDGEWQLRFKDGGAYRDATSRLNIEGDWFPHRDGENEEKVFVFKWQTDDVSKPLAKLIAAGIPQRTNRTTKAPSWRFVL